MLSNLLLVLASTAAVVSSQSINPDSVPLKTRQQWCSAQRSACPLLCLQISTGVPLSNNCTAETLQYSCICSSGISPNASQYSQTLPYFICTEANNQCVANCGTTECQSSCRTDHPCGAQDPIRVNVTTTTTSSSPSMTATSTSTSGGDAVPTKEATGAAPRNFAADMGQTYGMCVLIGGVVAGLAVLL